MKNIVLVRPRQHKYKYSRIPLFCLAVVGCISDGKEAEYREGVSHFVAWSRNNYVILTTNKNDDCGF